MQPLPVRLLIALTVVAQAALALVILWGLVALVWPRARRGFGAMRRALIDHGVGFWIAWTMAAVATGGSLYFSEALGWIPCQLCWFQRICMYPLAVVLLVAAIRRERAGAWYALVFPLVGIWVSIRHIYIEVNPAAESAACRIGGGGCATRWIDSLGYITIPGMSLTAFLAIGAILLMIAPWHTLRRRAAGSADASADYVTRP